MHGKHASLISDEKNFIKVVENGERERRKSILIILFNF